MDEYTYKYDSGGCFLFYIHAQAPTNVAGYRIGYDSAGRELSCIYAEDRKSRNNYRVERDSAGWGTSRMKKITQEGVRAAGLGCPCELRPVLPTGSDERKGLPMCSGLLDYFPAALAYVAHVSLVGNEKHNPGQPLHHDRTKSMDHADCIMRHLADRGLFDENGLRHTGMLAWRALALLQEELERCGLSPLPRGAKL